MSGAFTIAALPLLLAAYILRLTMLAKRTLSIGPSILHPSENAGETDWEEQYRWEVPHNTDADDAQRRNDRNGHHDANEGNRRTCSQSYLIGDSGRNPSH